MQMRLVRQSPLLALLVARAISETGTMLSAVALPLFVWAETDNTALVGAISAFQAVPLLLVGLLGGPVVDQLGPRRASVLADLIALVAFGLVPLLYAVGFLHTPALALLVLLGSAAEALGQTARASLTPELAVEVGWPLERANAAVSAIGRAAIVLGPLSAGILVSAIGPANVVLLDALSFGVAALLIGVWIPRRSAPVTAGAYWPQLRQGLVFLWSKPQILGLIALFCSFNALINPIFMVALPVYTSTVLGKPALLGTLIASFGGGTLAAALMYGAIGRPYSRRTVLVGCFAAIQFAFWPLVAQAPLPLLAAGLALMGLGVGPCGPLLMTTLAEQTPAELRGRVFGLYSAGAFAGIPLGVLLTGQLVAEWGLAASLLTLALGLALLTILLLALPPVFPLTNTTAGHT
jgi:MFS family permease